jgi:hypothetical protein
MAQSSKQVLRSLEETVTQLDDLALKFPAGMKDISAELKGVVSAITASQTEIHEISIGVKALQLDAQCKPTNYTVLGILCLINT